MWLCFIPLSVVSWSDQNFLMILEETFNFLFRFSLKRESLRKPHDDE